MDKITWVSDFAKDEQQLDKAGILQYALFYDKNLDNIVATKNKLLHCDNPVTEQQKQACAIPLQFIYCGFRIAQHNKDHFGQLVTVGIVSIFALQVVINIGMVMGLLPVVGITLPFVSYGRTSFMVFASMLGFLLNLSKKRSMF